MSNKIRFNNVRCPVCQEECFNTWGLIEHMKDRHNTRMPSWSARIAAALVITLALLVSGLPTTVRAQQSPQPQPTPTVGGGPQIAVEHKVFLPFVANGNDVKASVSWCPSCSPRR